MKKILHIFTVFILLSTSISLAFADEPGVFSNEVDIDAETQKQTEIMSQGLGAEIRLLQLEKAIITNINTGEEIVTFLEESDVTTIDLKVILAEFELLVEDVQMADPNASDAISVFVDLKHDAVNITKVFRETIRGLLNTTLLNQIQQRTRNITCNQTQNLSNFIQNKIRQYNSNQFRDIYQHLGKNGSKCIHHYQNGSITQNQVRQNITNRINQTEKSDQFRILLSLKQKKIRNRIQSQHHVQNAIEGFTQRQQNRLQRRLQRIEDLADNPVYHQLMKNMQNKIGDSDDVSTEPGGKGPNTSGDTSGPGSGQKGPGDEMNEESHSPGGSGGGC